MNVHLITVDGIHQHEPGDIAVLRQRSDGFVWVDAQAEDPRTANVLESVFQFHPLAVKDALERNRVPKMHAYTDVILVVLHAPERGDRGHVHYLELDLFIGHGFLVTVHGPVNPAVTAATAERETRAVLKRLAARRFTAGSAIALSHAIVSEVTRNQEEYIEQATADVWRLEQQVTGGRVSEPEIFLEDLFQVRHGLLAVRTMAALSGAIYGRLASLPGLPAEGAPLITENAEQFTRVRQLADGEREYLQGVIDFYQGVLTVRNTNTATLQNEKIERLTEASYAQNEEVKKISSWAAIFFAPSLVAAVYGMNFEHMPELGWQLGYPFSLLLMVGSGVALHHTFKKRNWL
ncbi:magnesium transporter CorA family protein [Kineosporia babensis]|uniref:Magnesium transporter CorA family protein n=1 Tax=Kineosporia babensis TaxID=499548 RepID=A0A9X1NDM1_9ACTN|nr:magnesium transporter CorA family protein [Kineosporia babensis]MCD5311850.1 magnesium transporter CorA family protein [Kineosporia babensis]